MELLLRYGPQLSAYAGSILGVYVVSRRPRSEIGLPEVCVGAIIGGGIGMMFPVLHFAAPAYIAFDMWKNGNQPLCNEPKNR